MKFQEIKNNKIENKNAFNESVIAQDEQSENAIYTNFFGALSKTNGKCSKQIIARYGFELEIYLKIDR
jgi:hypothetical protein